MLFYLLAYLGGMLTILSPCILPVLPFVFARAGRSFTRSTLPMLVGMAATFAIVATLAAVGGGWAVKANAIGRWAALAVATGLLWAPCAGPILGLIFTGAALQGASFNTTLLLLAYALGAATSLALALVVGGKVFTKMKESLGTSERIRQALGVLVL